MTDHATVGDTVVLERIEATDPAALRRDADRMEAAADRLDTVTERLATVQEGLPTLWQGASGSAFTTSFTDATTPLALVAPALRELASGLRSHAAATDDAAAVLVRAREAMADLTSLTDRPGDDTAQSVAEEGRVAAEASRRFAEAVETFHASEQRVRSALFDLGARAPGAIAVPAVPPYAEPSWFERWVLGVPEPPREWATGPLSPRLPGWDGPVGYDEDGTLVPAYRADVPWQQEYVLNGPPIGPLLRWIARGGRTAEGVAGVAESTAAARGAIEASYGFRAGHIDRHIREWYHLAKDAPVEPWMKNEYLGLLARGTARSQKVFRWSSGDSDTVAALHYDQETGRWIAVQFHSGGPYARQFATSFEPTPAQLDAMLRQNAVTLP